MPSTRIMYSVQRHIVYKHINIIRQRMKKLISILLVFVAYAEQAFGSEREDLLVETFQNVNGTMEATTKLDTKQLDNPTGWTFTNAFAGPQCVNMYFDTPRTYTFPIAQTPEIPAATYEVTVSKPGNLKTQLLDLDVDVIEGLTLKGKLNGADLKYLTAGEGRAARLRYVDISEVAFEYGGTAYRTIVDAPEAGMGTTYIYNYYLSTENFDEPAGSTPTSVTTNCYRNNLAAAFCKHKTIQYVVLPKDISSIGERTFEQCRELPAVGIPDCLTEVGALAFYYCDKLGLYDFPTTFESVGRSAFAGVKLGNVKFDKKVKLGEAAFNSSSIARLEMPIPSDTIPYQAFAYCSYLKEISIGYGLKYIADEAFKNADIETASLPSSIREIGEYAFDSCPFINNIQPEGGIHYIGKVAYKRSETDLSEYSVKDGTISLSAGIFAFCPATKFNIPASLEVVGKEAFACTQITSLPEMPSLKRIGNRAFRNCPNLARVTIPESIEYMGGEVFVGCNGIWSVTYNAIDAECSSSLNMRDVERIVIGNKVRRLPRGLYTDKTNITEVILPSSVEVLDPDVFSNCVNLEYVRLSDNITTISDNAFRDCRSLANLHWSANLKKIGFSAFRDCSSLKTISLPEGMESVGEAAFYGCAGTETMYLASTLQEVGYDAFTLKNNDKDIAITATAAQPLEIMWNWHYMGTPVIKVPAASLAAYQANADWNGSKNGKDNLIISIEGISAPTETSETSFGSGIDGDTDLGDTVIGDVYVTVGEDDGYDETEGAIVINSAMDEEYVDAVSGMAPGESDIANRFNGLVVQVPAGRGTVTINCITIGSKRVAVKIGEEQPQYYTKDSKGDINIDYNVTADTYVYIYASESSDSTRVMRKAPASDNCIRLYSICVNPKSTGIDDVVTDSNIESEIVAIYSINGIQVTDMNAPGVYIARFADGTTRKIILR